MAIHKLTGKVQHYDWGGSQFIPNLLGKAPDGKPCAEYWMGTHPNGPSLKEDGLESLPNYIAKDPVGILGEKVATEFDNKLPYLFKVLDVASMLSIQVHPTKMEAIAGFEAEELVGVPREAAHRNFKDNNHKPEIMVALSEFWLLHGFRQTAEITTMLETTPEFHQLAPYYATQDTKMLYQYLMEMPQAKVDTILEPLQKRLSIAKPLDKAKPDYWALRAFDLYTINGHFDRGIFSIYLLNLVKIAEGDAIFQGAGIPHAYLEGQNMELMANSDNVFRGGLTPKHIDVPMLLKHTDFAAVVPQIIKGAATGHEVVYKTTCEDFELAKIELGNADSFSLACSGPNVFFVYQGEGNIEGRSSSVTYAQGVTLFVDGRESLIIKGSKKTIIFIARMP